MQRCQPLTFQHNTFTPFFHPTLRANQSWWRRPLRTRDARRTVALLTNSLAVGETACTLPSLHHSVGVTLAIGYRALDDLTGRGCRPRRW